MYAAATTRTAGVSAVLTLLVTVCFTAACGTGAVPSHTPATASRPASPNASVVGMWVTADGRIRQELLADGRYEEARDGREKAYTGRYAVDGNHIEYVDDTGFTATGDIRGGVLYHEHLVLYREGDPRIADRGTR